MILGQQRELAEVAPLHDGDERRVAVRQLLVVRGGVVLVDHSDIFLKQAVGHRKMAARGRRHLAALKSQQAATPSAPEVALAILSHKTNPTNDEAIRRRVNP